MTGTWMFWSLKRSAWVLYQVLNTWGQKVITTMLRAVRLNIYYLPLPAADHRFQSSSSTTKVPTHNPPPQADPISYKHLRSSEKYHSTPETQTDDSYNHPEDIEHFSHHERIERQEAERESKFTGVSVEELLAAQAKVEAEAEAAAKQVPQSVSLNQQDSAIPSHSPVVRISPPEKQDPAVRYAGEKPHGEEWGAGERGYKTPRDASDRMRKNLPYKVGFYIFHVMHSELSADSVSTSVQIQEELGGFLIGT